MTSAAPRADFATMGLTVQLAARMDLTPWAQPPRRPITMAASAVAPLTMLPAGVANHVPAYFLFGLNASYTITTIPGIKGLAAVGTGQQPAEQGPAVRGLPRHEQPGLLRPAGSGLPRRLPHDVLSRAPAAREGSRFSSPAALFTERGLFFARSCTGAAAIGERSRADHATSHATCYI